MFLHAYNSYMHFAFPADELMPLSCKGRYRNTEPSRGTVDDALGNFSLSLIDSLDTLFLLDEVDEFERAVLRVIRNVSFNTNVVVSVFETNIRVLGGLLGGHVSALAVKSSNASRMSWYDKQLLDVAIDLGNRLLPSFNTSTGLPYPQINLRTGYIALQLHTCTACAGTLILEFAALSRLSGNPIYEEKASQALSYLWKQRNRYSDLVGTEINVLSGEWVKRESGVGAGIDSYYESLLKAYGLLGDPVYLHRFQTHYSAVERYMGAPGSRAFPFSFLSVFMHKPSEKSRFYMDALQAFWPGLQTINGDVNAAVAHHEMLFMVHQRHGLLPEAFTTDMDIYWPYHLIRPELVESTYLLYRSTGDSYYLHVGAELLSSIENYTKVSCGFAAIEDIRTMKHSDRMDSFVLAETFKYFYLLFSKPSQLPIDLEQYVLTTEAHILPIGLPKQHLPAPMAPQPDEPHPSSPYRRAWGETCAAPDEMAVVMRLFHAEPGTCQAHLWKHLEAIREPLRFVAKTIGSKHNNAPGDIPLVDPPRLSADDFNTNNITYLQTLRKMGIMVVVGKGGEILLKLNRSEAESPLLGLSGLKFIEDIIEMNQARNQQPQAEGESITPHTVALVHPPHYGRTRFEAGPSIFTHYPGESAQLPQSRKKSDSPTDSDIGTTEHSWQPVVGPLVLTEPFDACTPVYADGYLLPSGEHHADFFESNADGGAGSGSHKRLLKDAIAIVKRGGCMFLDKALHVKQMGARGVIVVDSTPGTSSTKNQLFYMSGDAPDGTPPKVSLELPFVFLYNEEGKALISNMVRRWTSKAEPAIAVIAKHNDSPRILSYSLRYLDTHSPANADDGRNCLELLSHVRRPSSQCSTRERIVVKESLSQGDDTWNITLGPVDDVESFVHVDEQSGSLTPKSPIVWSEFIAQHWPSTAYGDQCKDLMLAIFEATLSQIVDADRPKSQASVTKVSRHWRERISECLKPMAVNATDDCLSTHIRLVLVVRAMDAC
ncbi:unnamed protein product [Mesocestoides corti]|uniref:alpha-1,2-Mannosidase n=1 Tax=Mesocestoides corti TaxID=53468 RepID=A0A0R3UFS4_MESCO|nr:unnamed protein product [Mesocestoides corti]